MIPISKPFITEAEKSAVLEVLDSGMLAQGPRTAELEKRFAEVCGTEHAVATSSGTTALHLALLAHGIGPGDEVITSPFTFIASANSILFVGAKPVFADIEEDTYNIDPAVVEEAITPSTRALMPVHLYGQPCDMGALMDIARRHDLVVIEDSAQAIGAKYEGKPVGCFGTGVFSLYATKNVMSGEGGMITTDDEDVANTCRMLRNHGMERRYYHEMLGYNFRLTDLHAAIGLAQIDRLEEMTKKRRENAGHLSANIESVVVPKVRVNVEHVWHQYTVRLDGKRDRDTAIQQLNENGVGTGIFYPVPAHKQGYMRQIVGDIHLPVTEQMAEEVFSLPVHPHLTREDLFTIVNEVNKL
jgi:perosamine synthetase